MRGVTHPADHSPILAAALIACLAVLGGIVPGAPAPLRVPAVDVPSLARPGAALGGILDRLEKGLPTCEVIHARLIGNGGAGLNAVRTAYPKSQIVVSAVGGSSRSATREVLVCPR